MVGAAFGSFEEVCQVLGTVAESCGWLKRIRTTPHALEITVLRRYTSILKIACSYSGIFVRYQPHKRRCGVGAARKARANPVRVVLIPQSRNLLLEAKLGRDDFIVGGREL
jgi:hypothetical protein